tara:strand:+ start:1070 stop:1717 length:648 start_codon:yes stop_codon:yes gene_type:complete
MEQISSPANKFTPPPPVQQQAEATKLPKVKTKAPNERAVDVANANSRVVQRAEAQRAAAAAVSAAKSVVSSVTAARDEVASRGTTDVRGLIRNLDTAVRSATRGGTNFIGGSQGRVLVRNGDFGGTTALQTQPMDAESLGIADLAASISAGGVGPEHMLNTALALASDNARYFEKLHSALSGDAAGDAPADPASMLTANASSAAAARGGLVDLAA